MNKQTYILIIINKDKKLLQNENKCMEKSSSAAYYSCCWDTRTRDFISIGEKFWFQTKYVME